MCDLPLLVTEAEIVVLCDSEITQHDDLAWDIEEGKNVKLVSDTKSTLLLILLSHFAFFYENS